MKVLCSRILDADWLVWGPCYCWSGTRVLALARVPGLGRLPGDIVIEREGLMVFVPLGTLLLVSLVLTILAHLIARLWR